MIIFVDMDEVIADTYGAHIEIYNKDFNDQLRIEMCAGSEVWQNVPIERQASVREHATVRGFFRNLKPLLPCSFLTRWKKKVNG